MLLSEGLRGIVFDESGLKSAAVREVGPRIAGTAIPATGRRSALSARLAGPPDPLGNVVVVGRVSPRAVVQLDLGADGSFEGRARADARGRFDFAFQVDYGTTPVRLVALRRGRRPPAAELSVNRPDPRPPTVDELADAIVVTIVDQPGRPVLEKGDPGTDGNKYGFEGGSVIKRDGVYHLFTSEMVGDPFWVKMRLGHWTSPDRMSWTRVSTLYESSGSFDGTDPRAALWSPMPIYNDEDGRWELFYVAYRSQPSPPGMWLGNHGGQIWRAVSTRPGPDGIGGPYADVGVILQPGRDSDPWEGLQGTASFYPYRVGDRWVGFYGSAKTEVIPIEYWRVGLATAPELAGPWTRLSERNPVPLDQEYGVENPIVTRLASGIYVAIFDALGVPDRIGYTVSRDGIEWSQARYLVLDPESRWTRDVRTPLGLIPEGEGRFTLFYTGSYDLPGSGTYFGLGVLTLMLTTSSGDPIN